MKVFVTGATGYVGSAVCRALKNQGHEVNGLTSKPEKADLLRSLDITPVVGDMRDGQVLIPQAEQADVTIMCAQLSFGTKFTKKNLKEFADAEITSVKVICEGAKRFKRRVIYTAGYLIFGVGSDGWCEESVGFDPPLFSEGGAEASKYLLQQVEQGAITGCVFAPGFAYGPGGMFAEMASQIKKGKFKLPGGGKFYWSPVFLDDLANAYIMALNGKSDGKALLVVDDEPMLMRDIMFAIADQEKVKRPGAAPKFMAKLFMGSAMIDGITSSRRCQNRLIKETLGWRPTFNTFREGLPSVLEQLR